MTIPCIQIHLLQAFGAVFPLVLNLDFYSTVTVVVSIGGLVTHLLLALCVKQVGNVVQCPLHLYLVSLFRPLILVLSRPFLSVTNL